MPFGDWFALKQDEWIAKGDPPCEHKNVAHWYDSPGESADGYGCTKCGKWFEEPPHGPS